MAASKGYSTSLSPASFLATARHDLRETFRDPLPNVLSGLTVAVVALPLALAFGLTAFGPEYGPAAGIWSAILVGFIAAALGGAPYAITGPTGVLAVFTAALISTHGGFGSRDAVMFGFFVVALSGVLQVVFGALRLGRVVEYIPYPVVTGFMNGIALIILWVGLKDVLATTDEPLEGAAALDALRGFATGAAPLAVYAAAALAALALAITLLYPRLARRLPEAGALSVLRRVPGSLLALVLLTALAATLALFADVRHIRDLPSGLPTWSIDLGVFQRHPGWIQDAFVGALGLAAISSIDTLLTCVLADAVVGNKTKGNRELVAQGVGNAVAGSLGASQACGAAVRTMVNVRNGGRTRLSGISHALFLLAILLLGAGLATLVPIAVLSGLLLFTGLNMIEWRAVLEAHRAPKSDTFVMVATAAVTVGVGLVEGVVVGVVLASILFVRRMVELTDFVGEPEWTGAERGDMADLEDEVLVYEVRGPLFFGPAARFTQTFERADLKGHGVVIFRMNAVTAVDETGLRTMEVIVERLQRNGQTVMLTHLPGETGRRFERFGLLARVGPENVLPRFADALARARLLLGRPPPPATGGGPIAP